MRIFLRQILQSAVAKNFSKLFAANVVAQLIGLLVYPLLTRLYSPEDFGLYNFFLSTGGLLVLLATAEYQNAILFPKEDRQAVAVLHAILPITAVVVLVALLCVPFSGRVESFFGAPGFSAVAWLLPLYVALTATWVLTNYWLMRQKQFTSISSYQMANSGTAAAAKASWGFLHIPLGLVYASVVAPVVALIAGLWPAGKQVLSPLFQPTTRAQRQQQRAAYRKFPLFSLPTTLINNVSTNLPIWLLTPAFSLSVVGYYSLAVTLSFMPIRLITGSMYQVLFQQVTERKNSGLPFFSLIKRYWLCLLLLLPFFVLLWFVLPPLTQWLLGEGYDVTGEFIRLMLPWVGMTLAGGAVSFIPDLFQKQHISAVIELVYCLLRAAALLLGVWLQDIKIAIMAYSMVATIIISGQMIWYVYLMRRYQSTGGALINN